MATFDVAKLLNKITQDIPGINTVLKALAKWDVSALTDVPDGAMQATTDTNNRLTIKKKVSGAYTPVAKLMHDVDRLDGYHASASATANAVAVRNAQGALPGNITGNAATAATAVALAAGSVVPLNQGGTEATTASQARSNLGAAGSADFTAHIAKRSSSTVEGHIKLDALAADGSNTAAPGGYGFGTGCVPVSDLDNIKSRPTCFFRTDADTLNNPMTALGMGLHLNYTGTTFKQLWFRLTTGDIFYRGNGDASWIRLPGGITDSISTTSSTVAASATAVKTLKDSLRVPLTKDTTFYVRSNGNDARDGLTEGTALKTIDAAVALLSMYDPRDKKVIIDIGQGTFTIAKAIACTGYDHMNLFLQGAGVQKTFLQRNYSPSNIFINASLSGVTCLSSLNTSHSGATLAIRRHNGGGTLRMNGRRLTARCGRILLDGATIQFAPDDENPSLAFEGMYTDCGEIICNAGTVFEAVGNPSFNPFALCGRGGVINFYTCTFKGTAIGQKYLAYQGGVITGQGANSGLTSLLGDTDGTSGGGAVIGISGMRVEDPVHDKDVANKKYVDNKTNLQPSITGSITLNGTTNNTVQLTGIVPTLGLEVGDVIRIQYSGYNKLHTVESITNNDLIRVNYEHAGNRGNGSLKLPGYTGQTTVTRIAKWFNAPLGLGQAWVYTTPFRTSNTLYTGLLNRSIAVCVNHVNTAGSPSVALMVDGVIVASENDSSNIMDVPLYADVPATSAYKNILTVGNITKWSELR